jgi:hypothetical protein
LRPSVSPQWTSMIQVWLTGGLWLCLLAGCGGPKRPVITGSAEKPLLEIGNAIGTWWPKVEIPR